ncbi:aspartyl/asparaginyl beta-hydroxylase domain-containing protein [Nocardia sp. NPDC051570]|uniref:aspartyl/asparaginyl beta-hydroxylase domain-containing protein n=1 Tax=Nocardia sp. NPDC051570 TaxID=3364324 RepID=UPI0037B628A3
MPAWVNDSRQYLERWIDEQGVCRTELSRIRDGMDLSAGREPGEEAGIQHPEVFIPGLTATPWWDHEQFGWVEKLEMAYPDIKAEFESVGGLRGDKAISHPNSGNLAESGLWTAYYFYLLGREYSENIAECPRTVSALSGLDGIKDSGMCYFSIMGPGAHVTPHCGFINARIRVHLGLAVPEGARMRVGSQTRPWTEGKVLLFDDSFDHEVWNDSDRGRAVLLFDVWHPDLTKLEKRALAYMMTVWKTFLYKDA